MNNYIIDVWTPILREALSKFGYVFEVKLGKVFSVNERLNYTEIILNYEVSVNKNDSFSKVIRKATVAFPFSNCLLKCAIAF